MPEAEELLPSQVRARILREHASVRASMEAVARECRAAGGDPRPAVERLLGALVDLVALEHELLLPTLRTTDAWGQERARRLSAWHIDLRARIERVRRELAERASGELAPLARTFVVELRADLANEERTHLARELLRELPIPADLGGD